MARRRSVGEYILSFLSGGIRGASQVSQMRAAMNSKAALEAQKAKQKAQEKKQDNLFKIYSDINRNPDERQEAKNRYFVETGEILPTPRAKPEKVEAPKQPKVKEGPSALDEARTAYWKKQTSLLGKPKPSDKTPVDRRTQELNALSDDFRIFNSAKEAGDESLLYDVGEEGEKTFDETQVILQKRVEDFDAKWGDNLGKLIEQARGGGAIEQTDTGIGPPSEFLEDQTRKNAIDLIKREKGENFQYTEEDIDFVIQNYFRKPK